LSFGFESRRGDEVLREAHVYHRLTQIDESGFYGGGIKLYMHEEKKISAGKSVGPRHICFRVDTRAVVEEVANLLARASSAARVFCIQAAAYGCLEDPDGYLLEVASDKNF